MIFSVLNALLGARSALCGILCSETGEGRRYMSTRGAWRELLSGVGPGDWTLYREALDAFREVPPVLVFSKLQALGDEVVAEVEGLERSPSAGTWHKVFSSSWQRPRIGCISSCSYISGRRNISSPWESSLRNGPPAIAAAAVILGRASRHPLRSLPRCAGGTCRADRSCWVV